MTADKEYIRDLYKELNSLKEKRYEDQLEITKTVSSIRKTLSLIEKALDTQCEQIDNLGKKTSKLQELYGGVEEWEVTLKKSVEDHKNTCPALTIVKLKKDGLISDLTRFGLEHPVITVGGIVSAVIAGWEIAQVILGVL